MYWGSKKTDMSLQSSAYNKELQKKGQKSDTYFRKEEYL